MARRYAQRREEFDDLVQAGSVGLVKASSRFDPSRGVAFATFVAPAVEGEIRRHLRERSGAVRLPREMHRMSTELRRCRSELAASLGRPPDVRELAAALDADVREVERLIAADLARDPVALPDGPAGELPAEGEPQVESEYRVLLAGGLRALNARERRIVFLRFHADMTERQIARTIGISQAHVSRLLDGALTKLRAELTTGAEAETPGDIDESAVISPDPSTNIEHVGAREMGQDETSAGPASGETPAAPTTAETPVAPTNGEAATPSRRSARSKTTNGYSGRILVRMPSELHEQLALAAERDDISLNRYVNDALTNSVEAVPSPDSEAEERSPASEPAADARDRAPGSPRGSAPALRLALVTNLAIVVLAAIAAVVLFVLAVQHGI